MLPLPGKWSWEALGDLLPVNKSYVARMNAANYLAILIVGSFVSNSVGALESVEGIPDRILKRIPEGIPPLGLKVRKLYLDGEISDADAAVEQPVWRPVALLGFSYRLGG